MTSVINYAAMAVQQGADAGIQRVVSDPNCSLPLTTCTLPDTNERLLVDMSTGRPRPLVPAGLTRTIFDANHKLSHAGARAMRRLICDRFVWPGMLFLPIMPARQSNHTREGANRATADDVLSI